MSISLGSATLRSRGTWTMAGSAKGQRWETHGSRTRGAEDGAQTANTEDSAARSPVKEQELEGMRSFPEGRTGAEREGIGSRAPWRGHLSFTVTERKSDSWDRCGWASITEGGGF